MMRDFGRRFSWVLAAVAAFGVTAADAKDKVRAVDSTKQPFEHFAVHQAKAEGFFDAENLDVSIIFGDGGSATLQTLITGSADIAQGVGVLSVIAAYAKGAPVKILANMHKGNSDIFWYVPKDSPIKTLKDVNGKELAYSRPGSTTHLVAQFLEKDLGLDVKLVSVGGISASRTQVMSGQIPTGWSVFPAGADAIRKGEIRVIGTGDEAAGLKNTTIRVVATNSNWLKENRDAATRFMKALWKGQDFNFHGGDRAFERYAKMWDLDVADAKKAPEFVTWESVQFAPIGNLDQLVDLAVEFKMIDKPLTAEQKKDLVEIIYDPNKKM